MDLPKHRAPKKEPSLAWVGPVLHFLLGLIVGGAIGVDIYWNSDTSNWLWIPACSLTFAILGAFFGDRLWLGLWR